jgi:outer membrane protein TolC
MKYWILVSCLVIGQATGLCPPLRGQNADPVESALAEEPKEAAFAPASPSNTLLEGIEPLALRQVVTEVLKRNPKIARARFRAASAAARAPQVRALPDPVAALTFFVLPPETRVGPQRVSASIRQKLPWFGKLKLKEQAALYAAAAVEAEVETVRLDLLTETRRLYYELAFHEEHEAIIQGQRSTLARYEEAAQARYSAGMGLQQGVVRIQAQITRLDARLLEISERRSSLGAAINALRDRPANEPVGKLALPEMAESIPPGDRLRSGAQEHRPELVAAASRIAQRRSLVELAEKNFRPDVTLGVGYTLVGRRGDPAGRASPPPDNGDDVLAFSAQVNLPVWRRKLEAGLVEALTSQQAAEEDRRRILTEIEQAVGDLGARLPLLYEHWALLEKVLSVQAREALRSAEAAYTTGKLNAVDLLDSEVVLFEVQIGIARTRTDHAVARAQLERAVARPLAFFQEGPES